MSVFSPAHYMLFPFMPLQKQCEVNYVCFTSFNNRDYWEEVEARFMKGMDNGSVLLERLCRLISI